MVRFMVLSAPRSASTWAANWLTTDKTLCLHDPILERTPEAMDQIPCDRLLGISCTALGLLTDLVNKHAARKVIVHRDLQEVDLSLETIGLSRLGPRWHTALDKIEGMHVYFDSLFEPNQAKKIYEHLTDLPFDEERHAQLRNMYIEPNFSEVPIHAQSARSFRDRLTAALS